MVQTPANNFSLRVNETIRRIVPPLLMGSATLVGLHFASLYNYLLFHSLAEGFSIVVACGVFMLAWNSRHILDNDCILLIGVAYVFVAMLDLVHTLGYAGMGVFPDHGANLATQLWIGARYLEAASLVVAPLALRIRLRPWALIGVYAAVTALILGSIFSGMFPDCFIEGQGLTPFKVGSEYLICALLVVAAVFLYRHRTAFDRKVLCLLIASVGVTIASELAFTLYTDPFGFFNQLGHFLKIVSFYLIYRAVIVTGMARPYDLLYRQLSDSEERHRRLFEHMTEGMAVHEIVPDQEGRPVDYRFLDVNPAFEKLTGLKREKILGKRVTEVLPGTEPYWIEAFGRTALQGEKAHLEEYSEALGRWFEAFAYQTVPGRFAVVFNDVTERKEREKELRVFNEALEEEVARRTAEAERRTKQLHRVTLELTDAEERERRRLAQILHDDLQQILACLKMRTRMLADDSDDKAKVTEGLREMDGQLAEAIKATRSLSRDLHPPFQAKNIGAMIEHLSVTMRDRYELHVSTDTEKAGTLMLSPKYRMFVYRSIQELLFNTVKHSRCNHVGIELRREGDNLKITVADDGVGFDPAEIETRQGEDRSLGLYLIRARADLLGGVFKIHATPGRGSRFTLIVPVSQAVTQSCRSQPLAAE